LKNEAAETVFAYKLDRRNIEIPIPGLSSAGVS
jgi:hypothetical protein